MRFEFTIRTPDGDHDIGVAGTGSAVMTLGELTPRLLAAVGAPPDSTFDLGPETALGSPAWRTGSFLHLGASRHAPVRPDSHTLALQVTGGRDAGLVVALRPGRLALGRGAHCDVVLDDDAVSREHAELVVDRGRVTISDRRSTNGTMIEGRRIDEHELTLGDSVRVGDTLFTVRGDTPEIIVRRANDPPVIDIADSPPPARAQPTRWLAVLLPALAGGGLAWFAHSPAFLLFALLSPLLMLATAFSDRLAARRSGRHDAHDRQRRHDADDQLVSAALRTETTARRGRFPDAGIIATTTDVRTERLWERQRDHPDVLRLRLGTADQPSWAQVRCGGATRPAGVIVSAPLLVDLRDGPLGLAGPDETVRALARWLIVQLAVLHPPADVRLALWFADPTRASDWSWARWLPHLDDRVLRGEAGRRTMLDELTDGERTTVGLIDVVGSQPVGWPDSFAADASSLRAVVLADAAAHLPTWCANVVDCARPIDLGTGTEPTRPLIDQLRRDRAESIARALAPLVRPSDERGVLPGTCDLLDVLGLAGSTAARVRERWGDDDGRAHAAIGVAAGGTVTIDLDRDGPHLLIAGTTGSGKSELLRSLVLGLALLHPPDAVTFVLIDFKGGATFASCSALPHVVGSVTDLDRQLAERALLSLEAELRRREILFAASGATDLAGYRHRLGHDAQALARLVIVIDEFATLADELPDVLRGVVSVAQRGRSLGVHLVLATQRPGTAVTAEVRANTAMRIALRVIEPAESHEIVGVADAAAIPSEFPGRAVLSRGGGPLVFQAAGVGQAYATRRDSRGAEPTVERLGPWRRRVGPVTPKPDEDGCARIVELVRAAAAGADGGDPCGDADFATPRGPWLPPLPELINAAALPAIEAPQRVPFAVVDLPSEQQQPVLDVDLSQRSSWLLVGGRGSGRTTALASLGLGAATGLDPAQIEIYVLDGAGRLAERLRGLPHVASVLGPDDLHLAEPLLRRVSERVPGSARTLILVDHAEHVLLGDGDVPMSWAVGSNSLLRRSGATVVVAGSPTLLSSRAVTGFEHRLLMRLPDRSDYSLAGLAPRAIPTTLPPGRAVRMADGALLQIAVRDDVGHRRGPRSSTAVRLRPLPATVTLADLALRGDDITKLRLGLIGDAAECLAVDPFTGSRRWLVAGPPHSGKTTLLHTLLLEAHRTRTRVVVAAASRSALHECATELGAQTLLPSAPSGAVPTAMGPTVPTLVLVDDVDAFAGTSHDESFADLARGENDVSFVVAGRSDELAATHLGLVAVIKRARSGVLLRPRPSDGDLFGTRLRSDDACPPGRGVLIGEAAWLTGLPEADPVSPLPIQVARP